MLWLKPSVELTLETTNDTIIRTVVIFAEGIFKGESQVIHPIDSQIQPEISVTLRPPKDIPIDLHIKALVGYKSSFHYHVFELTRHLPRFAMYAISKGVTKPQSFVTFILPEKLNKVVSIAIKCLYSIFMSILRLLVTKLWMKIMYVLLFNLLIYSLRM